jgi:hypothetical protein
LFLSYLLALSSNIPNQTRKKREGTQYQSCTIYKIRLGTTQTHQARPNKETIIKKIEEEQENV